MELLATDVNVASKMSEKMLSIVIITKNEQKLLPKLLKSIKAQTYVDYEIIVSDANSKDKTIEIALLHGCKVIDGGLPAVGRNNGAKIAKGDILLFLDADVVLPFNFLKDNLKEFKKRKLSSATVRYVPLSSKQIDIMLYGIYDKIAWLFQYFSPLAGGFCIFCRKSIFNKVKGFDEKIKLAEDHDFVKRCGKIGKFKVLKSVPLLSDVRRLKKEGRFVLFSKYLYGGLYRIFKGEIYEVPFDYKLQGNVNVRKIK